MYAIQYTRGMAKTVPVRELRSELARLLDDVVDRREHVIVTRHGRPAAALIPIDEYEALEETAEILSDPDALALLEREPDAGHELRGRLRGLRSLRVGSYRVVYQLVDGGQTVRVAAIRHRASAYRGDPR